MYVKLKGFVRKAFFWRDNARVCMNWIILGKYVKGHYYLEDSKWVRWILICVLCSGISRFFKSAIATSENQGSYIFFCGSHKQMRSTGTELGGRSKIANHYKYSAKKLTQCWFCKIIVQDKRYWQSWLVPTPLFHLAVVRLNNLMIWGR